ncbi:MAG: WG repeat-containing protein, partial [Coprobacter sp.]|nr:WG repeat-containing protein [Coprobacter sp.]
KPQLIPGCEDLIATGYHTEGVIPIVRKDERISLVDVNGETKAVLEPINGKEVILSTQFFMNGNLIIMLQNGKWGTVNRKGETIIEPIYNEIQPFSEGICIGIIKEEEKQTIVALDSKGKELFRLKDNYSYDGFVFRGGRMTIQKGDVLGYIDKKGEFTKLPAKFEKYFGFSDKYYAFCNSDYKWGIVNKENDVIVRAKYEEISYIDNNMFLVKNGDTYQIINDKADVITEIDEKEVISLSFILQVAGLSTPFYLIGGENNSIMFYDKTGKATTKNDFYSVNIDANSNILKSDYFDFTGAVSAFADHITETGTKTAALGEPIRKYATGEPADYRYDYSISEPVKDFNFHNASMSIELRSDEVIANREPVYSYEEDYFYIYRYIDRYKDIWNTKAKLDKIELTLEGPKPIFEKGKDLLVNILKNKGFNLQKNEEAYAVLSNGKTWIVIGCPDNLNNIEASMMTEAKYQSTGLSRFVDSYERASQSNRKGKKYSYSDEIVVDTTVVVDTLGIF